MTGEVDRDYPLDPRAKSMTTAQLTEQLKACGHLSLERLRWVVDRGVAQSLYELHPEWRRRRKRQAQAADELERRYP